LYSQQKYNTYRYLRHILLSYHLAINIASSGHHLDTILRIAIALSSCASITDRIDHRDRRPNGREVVAKWDAAYPEWTYRGNTRTMWRDYNRALRAVAPEIVPGKRRQQ
jgi:hypothetical protein